MAARSRRPTRWTRKPASWRLNSNDAGYSNGSTSAEARLDLCGWAMNAIEVRGLGREGSVRRLKQAEHLDTLRWTLAWLVFSGSSAGSAMFTSPVASASLSDIAPAARRGGWLSTYSTAQGAGQAIGPILAGYAIAAGRFDLAFAVSGLIGLGAPLIVGTWRGPGWNVNASFMAGIQARRQLRS